MTEERTVTLLERLFGDQGSVSILGHLAILRPMEFSVDELSAILSKPKLDIAVSLKNLLEFEMIEEKDKKFRISDSDHTRTFLVFVNKLLLWNFERLVKLNKEPGN